MSPAFGKPEEFWRQFALPAQKWLQLHTAGHFSLEWHNDILTLRQLDRKPTCAISVDFLSGALGYRLRHASKHREALALAVGIKGLTGTTVLDATAGLGRDALILASIGGKVRMLERNPVVAALLVDGLRRAHKANIYRDWIDERLNFLGTFSLTDTHACLEAHDVVYLDPMFPSRDKSAMVKKEMQILQRLVGTDDSANQLLSAALSLAVKRVVVKRPIHAPYLMNSKPNSTIWMKKIRFDLYFAR